MGRSRHTVSDAIGTFRPSDVADQIVVARLRDLLHGHSLEACSGLQIPDWDRLPPTGRLVLHLMYGEDKTVQEIVDLTRMPARTTIGFLRRSVVSIAQAWAFDPTIAKYLPDRTGERWNILDSRRQMPPEVRYAVYERDGYRCVKCFSGDDITLDHIHPYSKGGQDTVENLRVLCRSCNSSKGAKVEA